MSAYTDHLAISPVGELWQLERPLVWEIGKKGSGLRVAVPIGFQTDLASIPWFARPVFKSADARYAKASILHDFLLESGWSPITAAAEFASALLADDVKRWRATVMGLAVLSIKNSDGGRQLSLKMAMQESGTATPEITMSDSSTIKTGDASE